MNASNPGRALVLGLALFAASTASVAGCSGGSPNHGRSPPGEPSAGTIGLQLTLPGGEAIASIAYTITGPSTYSGTEDVSGTASTFSFVITDVAPGSGYTLELNATSVDGLVICEGTSSPFSVAGNRTTAVNVFLACTTTMEAGAVLVDGVGFNCASWHTAIANPATATPGESVSLVGWASGPDPDAVTYQWSAPSGTITDATSANATFTCPTTPGEVTITLTVADGLVPPGAACPAASSTTALTVMCASSVSLVASCEPDEGRAWCWDSTHGELEGARRDKAAVTFTITNEGTSATGPLEVSRRGSVLAGAGLCENRELAPGESCGIDVFTQCQGDQNTGQGTLTISDLSSGASLTLTIDTTCLCTAPHDPCESDSECCSHWCNWYSGCGAMRPANESSSIPYSGLPSARGDHR